MIRDGYIVHGDFAPPLLYWDLPSSLLSAFFVAAQMTLLSYQATALCFDLLLGCKKRGMTKAASLHTLLLIEKASVTHLLAAIFRRDFLDRARFHNDIPRNSTVARTKQTITPSVLVRLSFLFLIAPVFNVLSVLLTLEHETPITFTEARFGGAALGINPDLSTALKRPSAGPCHRFVYKSALDVERKFQFRLCSQLVSLPSPLIEEGEDLFQVQLLSRAHGIVEIHQDIPGFSFETFFFLECHIGDTVYRVKPVITTEAARAFANHGTEVMRRYCLEGQTNSPSTESDVRPLDISMEETRMTVSKIFRCSRRDRISTDLIQKVSSDIHDVLTVINADKFEVVPAIKAFDEDNDIFSSYMVADDLIMMTRVRRNVSPVILSLVVGSVLILRMVVKLFSSNDLYDGLEAVMKSFLGMSHCDSLLARDVVIKYNYKFQCGTNAHYGVKCNSLPEVDAFKDGIIGSAFPVRE